MMRWVPYLLLLLSSILFLFSTLLRTQIKQLLLLLFRFTHVYHLFNHLSSHVSDIFSQIIISVSEIQTLKVPSMMKELAGEFCFVFI